MICNSCLDHTTDGVCYDCYEAQKVRISILEESMQALVDSIRISLPDGYVDPSKEPDFIAAFNGIEELLK